ncbi:hypothetical protein STXM2123_4303 [Streptomyces sp. F-3]|nr:hypothetical protein STXM2123_4303 [Streptomyces sp. F-3]
MDERDECPGGWAREGWAVMMRVHACPGTWPKPDRPDPGVVPRTRPVP